MSSQSPLHSRTKHRINPPATASLSTSITAKKWTFSTVTVLLTAVLILGALLRLIIAWRDLSVLDTIFFPDDTYISLGIARNIALGFGSTLDRHIMTNGYQPLYVWLMVPIYWIFSGDRILPIHIAVTLLALANTATGWLIYRITRQLSTPFHALLACSIWMFDPVILFHGLNGLETGLALLGIAASSWWYLTRIRSRIDIPAPNLLIFGLLIGLTVLTRIDQAFLFAAMGLDYLLEHHNRRAVRHLLIAGMVAFIINLPWFVFGYMIGTGPMPESGAAIRFHAQAEYAHVPPITFGTTMLLNLLKPIITTPVSTLVLLISGIVFTLHFRMHGKANTWFITGLHSLRPLRFALFYGIGLVLAYGLLIQAMWFFPRYMHPLALFLLISSIIVLPNPGSLNLQIRSIHQVTVAMFVLFEAIWSSQYIVMKPIPNGYFGIANWANTHLAGSIIGTYQPGALCYWGENIQVVDLDGIIDHSIIQARRNSQLGTAIYERGVDWVLHWDIKPGYSADGDLSMLKLDRAIPGIYSWNRQWYLFKVESAR